MLDVITVETTHEPGGSIKQRYGFVAHAEYAEDGCPPSSAERVDIGYDDHGIWGFEIVLV